VREARPSRNKSYEEKENKRSRPSKILFFRVWKGKKEKRIIGCHEFQDGEEGREKKGSRRPRKKARGGRMRSSREEGAETKDLRNTLSIRGERLSSVKTTI